MKLLRECIDGGRREGKGEWIVLAGNPGTPILLPANGGGEGFGHGLGLAEVPLVVKAPDDEVVILHVGELLLVNRIVDEERVLVAVVVEGRLVGDDKVCVESDSLAQDVHRIGEACHNAGDDCGRVAGFDGIDRVGRRLLRDRLLDTLDDLSGGELSTGLVLCGKRAGKQQGHGEDN